MIRKGNGGSKVAVNLLGFRRRLVQRRLDIRRQRGRPRRLRFKGRTPGSMGTRAEESRRADCSIARHGRGLGDTALWTGGVHACSRRSIPYVTSKKWGLMQLSRNFNETDTISCAIPCKWCKQSNTLTSVSEFTGRTWLEKGVERKRTSKHNEINSMYRRRRK